MPSENQDTFQAVEDHQLPDAQHRITLLMLMALLLLPLSVASYGVAIIAIIKGNYSVDTEMTHENAKYLGLLSAGLITVYLGLHWYVVVRYYQEVTKYLFGLKSFVLLYGLCVLDVATLIFTLWFDLYALPIYMIPLILLGVTGYLIYLRRYLLSGKHLSQ